MVRSLSIRQKTEERKGSFWNQYLAYTEDGNLIISVRYLEDDMSEDGIPSERGNIKGEKVEFVVDYVKVYQYKDLMSD